MDILINFLYPLCQSVSNILHQVESGMLSTISMALVTILIPVSIAIFGNQKEFEILDKNVILDYIIKAKIILIILGLIFIPLCFWSVFPDWRILIIFFWILGIYFMLKILINVYHWVKGNRFNLRIGYLKKIKNPEDMVDSWRSIWEAKNINFQNEKEIFKSFYFIINSLFEKDDQNFETILKLLDDFGIFIDNRSITFLIVSDGAFPKILNWHFKVWEKAYACLSNKKNKSTGGRFYYREFLMILDSMFKKIEERALKEMASYPFFETFKKHIDRYEEKFVQEKEENKQKQYYSYLKFLFSIFYRVFFEVIEESPEKYEIWEEYFPKEWKITKNNLINKENIISEISLYNFLHWAQERILQPKEEFDKSLNDISQNLFPEVEPSLWARILIFVLSPSPYGENRVKSIIKRPWNFGFVGRMQDFDYAGSNEKEDREKVANMIFSEQKEEAKNTFDLAYLLFSDQFSKENLEKYIAELKELHYEERSKEEYKRLRLLEIFKEMLEYKKNKEEIKNNFKK